VWFIICSAGLAFHRWCQLSSNVRRRNQTSIRMPPVKNSAEVVAAKDETVQQPIPTAWRPVLTQVVSAFTNRDYCLSVGVPGVERPSIETAEHIRDSIATYGTTLIELPEESWESSVCMWQRTHWDALIDLWTEEEGRSDLVLGARIAEESTGYSFKIHIVYVP
jgi:hypothetical protein